jgi:type II secretory pathway pseudopilin PulG
VRRVPALSSSRKAVRRICRAAGRTRDDGFTLIEAALVLALTGVLLAAFVPTFIKHVHTSKLAEATELLDSLHRHAAAYYEHAHAADNSTARGCLPESAGPFPPEPSVDPVEVDFAGDELGKATWLALGQTKAARLRYSYEVSSATPGCSLRQGHPSLTFRAHGDLDGDGNQSLLERTSVVETGVGGAIEQRQLVPRGPLRILSRVE